MEIDYQAFIIFLYYKSGSNSNSSLFPLQHTIKSLELKTLFPRHLANSTVAIATIILHSLFLTFFKCSNYVQS